MRHSKLIDHLREDERAAKTMVTATLLRSGLLLASVVLLAVLGVALSVME